MSLHEPADPEIESGKVKQLVDVYESRNAVAHRPPKIPSLRIQTSGPSPPSLDDEGLMAGLETAEAMLTSRVARKLGNVGDAQVSVMAAPTRVDFLNYARKRGLSEAVAKQDDPIPVLVDYKSSSRCADFWIQEETGHVVFAFGRRTLGCVHISGVERMDPQDFRAVETPPPPPVMELERPLRSGSRSRTWGISDRSLSRTFSRKRSKDSKELKRQVSNPPDQSGAGKNEMSAVFPYRLAFKIVGRPLPLVVGYKLEETRSNAMRKLRVLKDFFDETAKEAGGHVTVGPSPSALKHCDSLGSMGEGDEGEEGELNLS